MTEAGPTGKAAVLAQCGQTTTRHQNFQFVSSRRHWQMLFLATHKSRSSLLRGHVAQWQSVGLRNRRLRVRVLPCSLFIALRSRIITLAGLFYERRGLSGHFSTTHAAGPSVDLLPRWLLRFNHPMLLLPRRMDDTFVAEWPCICWTHALTMAWLAPIALKNRYCRPDNTQMAATQPNTTHCSIL